MWYPVDSVDQYPMTVVDVSAPPSTDPVDIAARLRSAPPSLMAATASVVMRCPNDADSSWGLDLCLAVRDALDRLRISPAVHALAMPIGAAPWHVLNDAVAEWDIETSGRARRVEITALIEHQNGIWSPTDYHFRLPSGSHGRCFVRIADAIRSPADAAAFASWLAPHIKAGSGILLDSSSLVSVALALQAMAARVGVTLGPVVSLEEYPTNYLDTMKAVRDVDEGSNVVALVSVQSTGAMYERLSSALSQVASNEWTIHILADKSATPGGENVVTPGVTGGSLDRTETWSRLGKPPDVRPDQCDECRAGPARLAHIDPRTFAGMVLPAPELLMPDAGWAYRQREFWQRADEADAVMLEAHSDVTDLHPRYGTEKFMSVKVNFSDLLAEEQWEKTAELCEGRLDELLAADGRLGNYDVVLVDEREAEIERFSHLMDRLAPSLGSPRVLVVNSQVDGLGQADIDVVTTAKRILLFRLGLVSGLSLQQVMYAVQQMRRQTDGYEMHGLVVHLRPQDGRVRETLNNSLALGLNSLWESYLPEDRHPLLDEHDVISSVHVPLVDHAQAFLDQRLDLAVGFPADGQLLWGAGPHVGGDAASLSPMSYYGEGLRVRSAFAAIGAAVHCARVNAKEPRGAPRWRMFELPAILRSYYDPIIVSCILRWLRPNEMWWGDDPRREIPLLKSVLRRTAARELPMLLSELLLAASQSKIPGVMRDDLRIEALVAADYVGAPMNASLILGLALLDSL